MAGGGQKENYHIIYYGFGSHAPDGEKSDRGRPKLERPPAKNLIPVFGGGFLIDPDFDDTGDLADLLNELEDGR